MTDHLTPAQLSALVDGELAGEELNASKGHIDHCLLCAKSAVDEWLLKAAVAKAGRRYEPPADLTGQIASLVSQQRSPKMRSPRATKPTSQVTPNWSALAGWAAAAILLFVLSGWGIVQYKAHDALNGERAAIITEACDLHVAMLAGNQVPEVVSSDRHIVKPWFQGKLPFSFNLPETLTADTSLDGANLAYLHNHPVAQLLFSIGHHRVSVLVAERNNASDLGALKSTHDGFQVAGFDTDSLEVIAVSDVDPARLAALVNSIQAAQTEN